MIQRWFSTNPLSPEDERGLPTLFWRILAAVVVVRAVVIATAPVDLAGDEAYYWDWSRRLALGYFSKPPAIAWIMALAGWLGHDSVFGLRMAANLMTGGAALFVFLLGRSVYGVRAGFLAGVAFLATPATAALGFLMTIDAPLVLCWSAALYFAWRLLIRDEASPVRTLALVLSIALGMLAKQMMMLFPLLLLVFVCLHAPLRDRLRRPGFWFVILAPYLALLAPLGWNFRHDWITVRQTAAHFGGNADSMARMFRHITEFVLAEAVLVTPVGYILVLAIALFGLAAWPRLSAAERYLTIFGAPGLLATLAMTATQHVNANWPAVFYLAPLVLLAGWAVNAWSTHSRLDRLRRWCAPGLRVAIAFTVITYLGVYALGFDAIALGRYNPIVRAQGWQQAADAVQRHRAPYADAFVLAVGHRWIAAELAFYLPDRPRVYHYNPAHPNRVTSQYDLWPSPATRLGENALIVLDAEYPELPEELAECFERTQSVATIETPNAYHRLQRLRLHHGVRLLAYPPACGTKRSADS